MLTNSPELAIVCQSCGQERAGILLSRDTDLYLRPAILTTHCKALQPKRGQVQAESLPTYKPWLCPLNGNVEFAEPSWRGHLLPRIEAQTPRINRPLCPFIGFWLHTS